MGYGEIQRDTARYTTKIQLDTYSYSWIQYTVIVGYSGIQWICCKMARYRDTACSEIPRGYGEIQAGYK